jgi:phosphorylase kinase alpha/beta subunit
MRIEMNEEISELIRDRYTIKDLSKIFQLLKSKRSFAFPTLENGLFPAAIVDASTAYTGYSAVWARDNVYVAYSHYISNEFNASRKNMQCLMKYFKKHKIHFINIIKGQVDPAIAMRRPHIRFDGENLAEIHQLWEHAQNDALGYFLWLYSKLISAKVLEPSQEEIEMLALFPLYFEAISYWKDEESGHWEETRKIEASSIGVVVAALKAFKQLSMEPSFVTHCCKFEEKLVTVEYLDNLIQKGQDALNEILPAECIQSGKERRYDSALLFLIYPLQVLSDEIANKILSDVINNLQGEYGISRYKGDSFWCRDYEDIPKNIRTSISTDREQWLSENERSLKDGEEAQWCIFDPIISVIFGVKFQLTHQSDFLEKQTFYLNRSLRQLTPSSFKLGGFRCPELYYLKRGTYTPNDATPLLWTQANLKIALKMMEKSLALPT